MLTWLKERADDDDFKRFKYRCVFIKFMAATYVAVLC